MPRPKPTTQAASNGVFSLLNRAAVASLTDEGEVVAMLETLRRTSPRDYIAAMVMIARLGQEVPQHERSYTVISAIPRSRLDETPEHMVQTRDVTTVN